MADRPSWQRWLRIIRRDPDDEVTEELEHHLQERIRDFVERGMDPEAARHAAHERLGDLGPVRQECARMLEAGHRRQDRRVMLNVSWLDVKLGLRMLAKYPGLSVVAVVGMAVAIAIGAGSFAFISAMLDPTLPLEGGDRIVSLQYDRLDRGGQRRQVLHDFVMWREELKTVEHVGAFQEESRNLVGADGSTDLVTLAEMTASGFGVTGAVPLLGRTFTEDEERLDGPPVLVVGYEEWRRRFDGDPDIVGTRVRLGGSVHTVVGVMPEGFEFPYNESFWVPLRLNPNDFPRGGGPVLNVFGRVAEGFTRDEAEAELAVFERRMAESFPDTHGNLRLRMLPYAYPLLDVDGPEAQGYLFLIQLSVTLLLMLVAVNVAVLVYARTATRSGEIAVRSALGASRRRVVAQLFVEGLVMASIASALGLTVAALALDRVMTLAEAGSSRIPFWFNPGLSAGVVAYTVGLAVVGGAIVGVLPALRATGRTMRGGLQHFSARSSQLQLGRVWTGLIVAQVAIAVAVLPGATFYTAEMALYGARDPGYDTDAFLKAWLSLERDDTPMDEEAARAFQARFAEGARDLLDRLNGQPGVEATLVRSYPGTENAAWIEAEGLGGAGAEAAGVRTHQVAVNHVGAELFSMFDRPVLAGRAFGPADVEKASTAVIVDRTFVDSIARGANAVGRRIRYPGPEGRASASGGESGAEEWFEIVGVVPDLPGELGPAAFSEKLGKVYHPIAVEGVTQLVVRLRSGRAADFIGPLRAVTAAVDPDLQLHELITEGESIRMLQEGLRMIALGIVLVTGSVLLLSAAGIYAMMSFTVARRRREIGIRSALGADPRRILLQVCRQAAMRLGLGAGAGLVLAVVLDVASGGWVMGGQALLVPAVAAGITAIGLLATLGPARRALAVQPTEALRSD